MVLMSALRGPGTLSHKKGFPGLILREQQRKGGLGNMLWPAGQCTPGVSHAHSLHVENLNPSAAHLESAPIADVIRLDEMLSF